MNVYSGEVLKQVQYGIKIERKLKNFPTAERRAKVISNVVRSIVRDTIEQKPQYTELDKRRIEETLREATVTCFNSAFYRKCVWLNKGHLGTGQGRGTGGKFKSSAIPEDHPVMPKLRAYFECSGEFENDIVDVDIPNDW